MPATRSLPLKTASLVLRRFEPEDARTLMDLNAEPSTRHWLPSHVYADLEAAEAAVRYLIGCCSAPGHPAAAPFVLALECLQSGQLIGHVGFSPFDEQVEVSYAVAESARGRGFGAEALQAACSWVALNFGIQAIVAITSAGNLPSRRVLQRCGFRHTGDESIVFQGRQQPVSRYVWSARPTE